MRGIPHPAHPEYTLPAVCTPVTPLVHRPEAHSAPCYPWAQDQQRGAECCPFSCFRASNEAESADLSPYFSQRMRRREVLFLSVVVRDPEAKRGCPLSLFIWDPEAKSGVLSSGLFPFLTLVSALFRQFLPVLTERMRRRVPCFSQRMVNNGTETSRMCRTGECCGKWRKCGNPGKSPREEVIPEVLFPSFLLISARFGKNVQICS